mgnify:CR=1 FL=1
MSRYSPRPVSRRRTKVYVAFVVTGCIATAGIAEQTASGPYLAITGAGSIQPDDLVGNAAFGGPVGYRGGGGFLVLGEYVYAGKDFYYHDGSDWTIAASWPDVPSGSSSRSEWIFYRERHAVGIAAGGSGAVGRLGLFGAGGFMLNIVSLSSAAEYYPEFEQTAIQSSIGDSTALLTATLRGGVVYPARSSVAGLLAAMVQLEPSDQLGNTRYYRRNTLVFVGITFQLGPLLEGGGV